MASGNKTKTQSVGYYKHDGEILGKGSFAAVYLARHKIIRCEVSDKAYISLVNRHCLISSFLKKIDNEKYS